MGQRSQTFIRVPNPVHYVLAELKQNKTKLTPAEETHLKKWKKALGTGEFTILAYHHQWLYGLTYPALMHQLLSFYKQPVSEYSTHPLNMERLMRDLEIGFRKDEMDEPDVTVPIRRFVEFHTFLLGTYNQPWAGTRDKGLEGFRFLNLEEPEMRERFDIGDNNDGVCIIDAVNGKYAFANIYDTFYDPKETSAASLKPYAPYPALEYVRAYYPTDPERIDYFPDPKISAKEYAEINAKKVNLTARKFKKFPLLTVDEIIAMFPKMEQHIRDVIAKF